MSTTRKVNDDNANIFSLGDIRLQWNEKVKTTLDAYMTIPNVSPAYDNEWMANGYIDDAMNLYEEWAKQNSPSSATIKVQRIENKTPLLIVDIPARGYDGDDVVLLYGHLDKQPPMTGWREGIEPFIATYDGDRLYGRGGADDGYALFSAMLACQHLENNDIAHARHIIVIEASEESGSPDLPDHLAVLDQTLELPLGPVSLVVCLDSGCLDYEHLWITQSLRGLLQINVSVRVLDQGTHSGGAGGIVPSAFHVLRELLDRICEPASGKINLPELSVDVPDYVREGANNAASILQTTAAHGLPFADGVQPLRENISDQIIANTYEAALEIIGIDGIPALDDAGNVLRPEISLALSFRLPPGVDPHIAAGAVTEKLLSDVPYNAQVSVVIDSLATGWAAPPPEDWISVACDQASNIYFDSNVQMMGEGGTIPFMAMLGEKYPEAQFMVTGVLGPESNAHGPNEFLDIPTAHKVTGCVAHILQAHGQRIR
ncbi:MAG TPA: M20/M25/M40 family metallo-hydrolase [Acidimicrobiia bacterium]|nr:M20/M25/M40 family metallo-hydrolase [Acidimicrobiia bacterium]